MGFSVSQGVNSVTCQRLSKEGQLKAHRYTTLMFMCTLSHHTEGEKSKNLNILLHLIESAKSFYIAPTFLKIDDKIDCYYPPKIH